MTAPATDQSRKGTERAAGSRPSEMFDQDTSGVVPPPPPLSDEELGEPHHTPWRTIGWAILVLLLIAGAVLATIKVTSWQSDQRLRKERSANALRDLNNRVETQSIGGKFIEVFYVNEDMRARFVSSGDDKRCVVRVIPPTEVKLRYSSAGMPATTKSWDLLRNPDAIGCLQVGSVSDVGGG